MGGGAEMNTTVTRNLDGTMTISHIVNEVFEKALLIETIAQAKYEIAKKVWEANEDKIMASMDIKGLANMIAVFASKKMAEDIKHG